MFSRLFVQPEHYTTAMTANDASDDASSDDNDNNDEETLAIETRSSINPNLDYQDAEALEGDAQISFRIH